MKLAKVKTVSSPENVIVPITSDDKPKISEELQVKWQKILDLAAKIIGVPSGLITKLNESDLEVFLSSKTEGNIFEQSLKLDLGLGWYCENVTGTRNPVILPNALTSDAWKDNPSVPFKMISYMGIPILWPDGEVFGTFCMLDNKENQYSEVYLDLLISLREIIQNDLKMLIMYRKAQNELQKKEIQIREVHHRIKNQFNLLISTLRLQSFFEAKEKNTESILNDIQSRISAISEIHNKLYKSFDTENISLGDYLEELGINILNNLDNYNVRYNCQSDEIITGAQISVPCGLILNELITNSLKHAFSNTTAPEINLTVRKDENRRISFIYKDNGKGLPEDFDVNSKNSLGLLMINQSVSQLEGQYNIKNNNGFFFEMNFSIKP
ncbi:MAG: GAF domain-containing protein [Ignavibacteria bacterium]|nr:GAF domain-containing protein [Ignavibacteria bacterium]